MKFRGDIRVIEAIEKLITGGTYYDIEKNGSRGIHTITGDNSKSRLFTRKYKVRLDNTIVVIKLGFDYRDDMGSIHIRDDKAWKLASALHDFSKQMSKLRPFYTNKWPRSQMMQAMDKLLE